MFTHYEYRKKALRYGELAKTAPAAKQEREFRALEERFMRLADNEEWLSRNHGKNVSAADTDQLEVVTLAKEEEHILRCLGAALILQWDMLPKKLQRELFDYAGSMGELTETPALRGQIARFLHKHETIRTRASGMPKMLLAIPRLSTAERYRKRASAVGAPSGPQAIAPSLQDRCDVSEFDKSEIGRDAFPLYNLGRTVVVASAWLAFYVFAAIHPFIASGN